MSENKPQGNILAVLGVVCLLGGAAAGLFAPQASDSSTLFTRGAAQIFFLLIGVGLIVAHFSRRPKPLKPHPHDPSHTGKHHSGKHHPHN